MIILSPRRSGHRHRALAWCRLSLLLGLISVFAPLSTHAQEDTLLLDAVVRLVIQEGPSEVLPALSDNNAVLLPLRRFLEMSEVPLVDFSYGEYVSMLIEPGNVLVTFSPADGIVTRGDSIMQLAQLDAVWRDNELYVSTATIDRVFNVASKMEWAALSVVVARTAILPVVRRARRERRRARLDRPERPAPEQLTAAPPSSLADGAVFEWSLNSPTDAPIDNLTMNLGAGAKILGGSFELRYQRRNFPGGGYSQVRGSWSRAWRDQKWIRQVRVGDVLSAGLRARSVQGVVITNAPFIRASEFDIDAVLGQLPSGWEVELYDRGKLRAWHEVGAGDTYRMPLQLRYGQNPFQLVLYGPGGEVIRETRTIRVPFSRLPAGQLEYAVASGRCRTVECRGMLSSDIRYGISNRVTVQAGSEYFWRDSGIGLWRPYAAVSAGVLPYLSLTGETVINDKVRASASLEPSPDFRVEMGHSVFDEDGDLGNRAFQERHRTEGSVQWRPGVMRSLFFRVTGMHSTGPEGFSRSLQQLTTTAYLARIRYQLTLRRSLTARAESETINRSGADLSAQTVLSGPSEWLRATNVRTAVGFDWVDGLADLRAGIGREIAKKVRFDIDVGWSRFGGFSIDVGFNTVLRGPRFGTRNHFSQESGNNGVMFVDGSVIVDPGSKIVHFSDGRDLGRAGVAGTVFFDENSNGLLDADESGLEGVPVHVGGWFDLTDEDGRFSAWDLFPFEVSYIQIDSLGFEDPRLVPAATLISVIPTPNSFQSIDIPVVVGAEISGYVVFEEAGLGGVPVTLTNVVTGKVIRLETFSDGVFYRIAVPPGEYEIGIPRETLEDLDAEAPPVSLNIPSGPGDKTFEDLIVTVVRLSNEPGILDRYTRNRENRARSTSEELEQWP